jgi:hypothetical protein
MIRNSLVFIFSILLFLSRPLFPETDSLTVVIDHLKPIYKTKTINISFTLNNLSQDDLLVFIGAEELRDSTWNELTDDIFRILLYEKTQVAYNLLAGKSKEFVWVPRLEFIDLDKNISIVKKIKLKGTYRFVVSWGAYRNKKHYYSAPFYIK